MRNLAGILWEVEGRARTNANHYPSNAGRKPDCHDASPGGTRDAARHWHVLRVVIVPDSGTGALQGITGALAVRIEGGKHFYDIEYAIKPSQ